MENTANAFNIKDFIKDHSFTGNPMIDSLIIANLVPFILSYITGVFYLCKNFGQKLMTFILQWIKHYLKSKLVGNVVCRINIKENNDFFDTLDDQIFGKYDLSSKLKNVLVTKLTSFSDYLNLDEINDNKNSNSGSSNNHQNTENGQYFGRHNTWILERYFFQNKKEYEIEINLNTNDKLISHHRLYGSDNIDSKTFKYKNYHLKFTKKKYQHGQSEINILMILFDKKDKNKKKTQYIEDLEDFFVQYLNIWETITYSYHVDLDANLTSIIKNYRNNYAIGTDGSAKLGNWKFGNDSQNEIKFKGKKNTPLNLSKKSRIIVRGRNISDPTKSYQDSILIYKNHNNNPYVKDDDEMSFKTFFNKYVSKDRNFFEYLNGYFYFINNNKIYLFYYPSNTKHYKLTIISSGLLTENNLKEEINYLIKQFLVGQNKNKFESIDKKEVSVHKRSNRKWLSYRLDKRTFETIYLPKKLLKNIVETIQNFNMMSKLYKEYQIPYRTGLLFYGPPGTGKSSLAKAIAYEFQMPVYVININDDEINDDSIIDILNSIGNGENKILLFEDIDSAFVNPETIKNESKVFIDKSKTKSKDYSTKNITSEVNNTSITSINNNSEKQNNTNNSSDNNNGMPNFFEKNLQNTNNIISRKYLTYSGLLNALDGVLSNQNGVITIMTTNYIEKLGKAFIRPGRIDYKFELKECNIEQLVNMTETFIGKRLDMIKQMLEDNDSDHHEPENNFYRKYHLLEKFDNETIKQKSLELAHLLTDDYGMSKITPSEFQFYLIRNIDNVEGIFTNYQDLLDKHKEI